LTTSDSDGIFPENRREPHEQPSPQPYADQPNHEVPGGDPHGGAEKGVESEPSQGKVKAVAQKESIGKKEKLRLRRSYMTPKGT
jgi:hypothetical protein